MGPLNDIMFETGLHLPAASSSDDSSYNDGVLCYTFFEPTKIQKTVSAKFP